MGPLCYDLGYQLMMTAMCHRYVLRHQVGFLSRYHEERYGFRLSPQSWRALLLWDRANNPVPWVRMPPTYAPVTLLGFPVDVVPGMPDGLLELAEA